jgi:hypothetical protein
MENWMIVQTKPGRADKPNEDYVTAASASGLTCAVLLDGAGGPSELATGCIHGTPWYVQQLGELVLRRMLANPGERLDDTLAASIEAVTQSHADTCDLTDPGTPASTVIMTRITEDQVDYLVLGDSTFIADMRGEVLVASDRSIDGVAAELRERMEALPTGTPEHQAARIDFVTTQRKLRNQPGGYWTASTDPRAAHAADMGTLSRAAVSRVAMLSDGVTRFVEFGLGTWRDLLDVLDSGNADKLFDRIREAEAGDPRGARWPRAKYRDDVAVFYTQTNPQETRA